MFARITKPSKKLEASISLPSSKSISNRLLMLRALSGEDFLLENLSEAEDTRLLQSLLQQVNDRINEDYLLLDCGNAGTVMRFLLPYLASLPGQWILTGSERMKERPVAPLAGALEQLGASIEYLEKSGYPPLRIHGKQLKGGNVSLESGTSSQFTSALMMTGSFLPGGLRIELQGEQVSQPYVTMTALLLRQFGIETARKENVISIPFQAFRAMPARSEPDWSSASYWFSLVCLAGDAEILLKDLRFSGLQGDEAVAGLFYRLGVLCKETESGLLLTKKKPETEHFSFDFRHHPDLAMTLAVAAAGLGITAELSGLKNLRLKESDRLEALSDELQKLGCTLNSTADSLVLQTSKLLQAKNAVTTYGDHRVALSFAPLALCLGEICLQEPAVITKSYPGFWQDLQTAGFKVEFLG